MEGYCYYEGWVSTVAIGIPDLNTGRVELF